MTDPTAPLVADIRDEAARLGGLLVADRIPARLMGGVAVWLRSPSVRQGPFARPYADLDFVVAAKGALQLKAFLLAQGYLPDQFFNALHGATRLYFQAPDARWSVDVVVDELAMSHKLDLRGRLDGPEMTIDLADLLLTKLQVWEINRKDLGDALCLIADHPLAEGGRKEPAPSDAFDLGRIGAVVGADWGFCHTVVRNLGGVADLWAEEPLPDAPIDVAGQVAALQAAIERAPKSFAWKTRARVGERVRWYETPEEVRH
ncbi:MAG TPA: hypothetical protein VID26_04625 [Candidatus Limnocylindrales bacterium]|jgi:hypothetical protein